MNDLISRNILLNAFNNTGIQITFDLPVEEILGEDVNIDDFTMLVQDAVQSYKALVIDTIKKKQQTAYDIDKVVEELKQQSEQYRQRGVEAESKGFSTMADKYYGKQYSYEHAIEIVRQGGIGKDVEE